MVVVAMVDPDHTKHDDNPEKKIHATDAIPTADLGLPFFFVSLYTFDFTARSGFLVLPTLCAQG